MDPYFHPDPSESRPIMNAWIAMAPLPRCSPRRLPLCHHRHHRFHPCPLKNQQYPTYPTYPGYPQTAILSQDKCWKRTTRVLGRLSFPKHHHPYHHWLVTKLTAMVKRWPTLQYHQTLLSFHPLLLLLLLASRLCFQEIMIPTTFFFHPES